ncbi:putative copia-like polyprotein [Tanacetum coccineum]
MDNMAPCTSYSFGKLIARPLPPKVKKGLLVFLERIQGDIYGSIHPPCGPFRYFMVLIDASSRWPHVSLLSTRNMAFAKFLSQIFKLKAHFLNYTIKCVRLDNVDEFISQAFKYYCMSIGIVVEHPVAHLPDAFKNIKRATKSYIPGVNALARVEILDVKYDDKVTQESKARLKLGRPIGSKDKNPRKTKATKNAIIHEDIVFEGTQNVALPEEEIDDINKEVSINYGHLKMSVDQIKTEFIDEKFSYNVACNIMNGNDDPEPTSVIACQRRHDRNKWKEATQAELNSLNKR